MSDKQDKISIINSLLNDEDSLAQYIDSLEKQEIVVPNELNKSITNIIKISDSIKSDKSSKFSFIDICKVACFALVTVLSWEFGFSKINNIDFSKLHVQTESVYSQRQDNTITDRLGKFMMSEIYKGGNNN